jgi:hypothetical protein
MKISVNEYMAHYLRGLAQRVEDGEIVAFDLAWNYGPIASQDPSRLFGPIVVNGSTKAAGQLLDVFEAPWTASEETAADIQADISKALAGKAPVIDVVDMSGEPTAGELANEEPGDDWTPIDLDVVHDDADEPPNDDEDFSFKNSDDTDEEK